MLQSEHKILSLSFISFLNCNYSFYRPVRSDSANPQISQLNNAALENNKQNLLVTYIG
jgi:hypothetical protein